MLKDFVVAHRSEIIAKCREKVATRTLPPATPADIDHGVPAFLEELIGELDSGATRTNGQISLTAGEHGHDLLLQGFTPSQVVHDYGDVCQVISEMALEQNARINTDDFRKLNQCLDDAIAAAITRYGQDRDASSLEQSQVERDRLRTLADASRAAIMSARAAFEAIKDGQVGHRGSTGMALDRSLEGLEELNDLLLEEIVRRLGDPDSISSSFGR